MKALRNLALTLIVPVLVSSLSAAEKPEIVDEYLPVGKMAEAAAVSVVLDESLQPFMEKIDGVFASLPDKDKKELVSQIVPGQPTLVLDVAHNPHSVAALTANLDAMGYFPATHAVFGAMADKDLAPMLAKVGPLVDHWYFTDLPTPRAETGAVLQQKWNALQMVSGGRRQVTTSVHADPVQALQAAVAAADPADRIVVFGSFYTVGGVLINGIPRLHAKHLDA